MLYKVTHYPGNVAAHFKPDQLRMCFHSFFFSVSFEMDFYCKLHIIIMKGVPGHDTLALMVALGVLVSCPDPTPHVEEKGSGYNTTSRSTQ